MRHYACVVECWIESSELGHGGYPSRREWTAALSALVSILRSLNVPRFSTAANAQSRKSEQSAVIRAARSPFVYGHIWHGLWLSLNRHPRTSLAPRSFAPCLPRPIARFPVSIRKVGERIGASRYQSPIRELRRDVIRYSGWTDLCASASSRRPS